MQLQLLLLTHHIATVGGCDIKYATTALSTVTVQAQGTTNVGSRLRSMPCMENINPTHGIYSQNLRSQCLLMLHNKYPNNY